MAIRGYLFNLISERIAVNLRQDLYISIINKDIAFFDARKTGDFCNLKLVNVNFYFSE